MPNVGYFDVAFGIGGSRTVVPDAAQPGNTVSYTTGYTPNYALLPTQPGYLPVDEGSMNQLFFDITSAIQTQQQGLPAPFITSSMNNGSPFPYGAYATVLLAGIAYISLVSNNLTTPPSSSWSQLNITPNNFIGGTTGGSANALTLASVSPSATVFTNGQSIVCTAGLTNTGASTFDPVGAGVLAIQKDSGSGLIPLAGGEIVATNTVTFTKNDVVPCWVLNAGGNLGALAYLGISGNSGANDGSGNYAPAIFNQASTTGASKVYAEIDWGNLIQRSDSGSAMTDTLPGTSGALPNGWEVHVKNADLTASNTISAASGGSVNIGGTYAAASFIIEPGDTYLIVSQGMGVYNAFRVAAAAKESSSIQGSHSNLKIFTTSETGATIDANYVTVRDSSGNSYTISLPGGISYATGSSGAGGLDTGSLADSEWYNEFVIYDPTTRTAAALISLSATAPTLPTGYTAFARVGSSRVDASGHLLFKVQYNSKAQYVIGTNPTSLPQMISGASGSPSTPTWTAVAIAAFVPPLAGVIKVLLNMGEGTSSAVTMAAPNNSYGVWNSASNPPPLSANIGGLNQGNVNMIGEFLIESGDVYYASTSSQASLNCMGWEDNL